MKKLFFAKPEGATSLLVVVGLSMTLLAIITGVTVVSVRESRQALDTDLSNRALAAAQASAIEAAQQLSNNPDLEYPNCDGSGIAGNTQQIIADTLIRPVVSTEADNQISVVCRTVSSSGSEITSQLSKDQTTQVMMYLGNTTGVDTLKLEWNKATNLDPFSATVFPNSDDWGDTPAALEISVYYWSKSTPLNQPLSIKTIIILPSSTPSNPAPSNGLGGGNLSGSCSTNANPVYSCSASISLNDLIATNFANNFNAILRVKALYRDTDIAMNFSKGTDKVNVRNTKAVIDVTAKAGNLYRRVIAEKPLANESYLDSVIYSEAGVCKNLRVFRDGSLAKPNSCN